MNISNEKINELKRLLVQKNIDIDGRDINEVALSIVEFVLVSEIHQINVNKEK